MKEKKVFVSGNFNILHPGHLRLLQFAKNLGKYLVVGVNADNIAGKAAFIKQNLRMNNIKNLDFVDKVILIKNLEKSILSESPDIVVKGKEFRYQNNPESEIVKKIKSKLVFSSGENRYSSASLFKKEILLNDEINIDQTKEYLKRNRININNINKKINSIKNLKICVIGDIIIDEYINSNVLGLSNEEPCIVLNPVSKKRFLGGAGIVASHASSLGAETYLFGIIGKDDNAKFVIKELKKNKVKANLQRDIIRPTTLKQRFKVENKSQLKVSYLSQEPISIEIQEKLLSELKKILNKIDLLIFSDFNYGCLPQKLVDEILKIPKNKKLIISADSQSSSQIGDISRFTDADLITPTENEARISVKNNTDGLVVLTDKLQKISKTKNIILTLNSEGILIYKKLKKDNDFRVDKLPALNTRPKDISGSGDSLLIMSSISLSLGLSIWEASWVGSLFAALQSSTIGNQPIKLVDLKNLLKKINKKK